MRIYILLFTFMRTHQINNQEGHSEVRRLAGTLPHDYRGLENQIIKYAETGNKEALRIVMDQLPSGYDGTKKRLQELLSL